MYFWLYEIHGKIGARVLAMGVMSHNTGRTKPGEGNQPRLCPATVTFDPGKTRELVHQSVLGLI